MLGNCNDKEVDFNPKAIVIVRMGDVKAGGRVLALSDEISDKDVVTVGAKSICDLQILESDSLVVVRLKEYSRFKLWKTNRLQERNQFHTRSWQCNDQRI